MVVVAEDDGVEDPVLLGDAPPALAVRADLRNPDEVERAYRAVTSLGRPVDVLVLNAGVGQGGPFPGDRLSEHLSVVDLNVRSTVHLAGLALPADTNFFDRADLDDTRVGQMDKDDAATVARAGLDALFAGDDHVVAGSFKNKVMATLGSHLPDAVNARGQAKLNE